MKRSVSRILSLALMSSAFLASFGIASAQSNDPVVAKVLKEGIENNKTMEHLDILSNRFGGRIAGSSALQHAEDWAEYVFKSYGLEVYRQEVETIPIGFDRGPWFGKMIGGSNMTLHFVTPSYTVGTKGVQKGKVVKEPRTRAEFERMKGKIKGSWVLIGGTSNWPIDFTATGDAERAKVIAYNDSIAAVNARNRRAGVAAPVAEAKEMPALFYKEMVEAGALGFIQASPLPLKCLYDRKNLFNLSWDNLPKVPEIKLDENQYKVIAKMVEDREDFELQFDIRNHFFMSPVKIHNIIAVLKGSEYPDEYVICGGHLDAFDAGTGGVDCGVGSTVSLEAARLLTLAGAKPKRSIIFALWTAEENGLWGSKYFVEHNTAAQLRKISNYFNRDGGPTMCTGIEVPEAMYNDFVKVCAPLKEPYGFEVRKRTAPAGPIPTTAGSSDHAYFAMNGVPTLGFTQGDPKGYDFQYGEIWHTDRDTYDKSIAEYQEAASVITAVTMYGLANLDHVLSRKGLYSNGK